MHRLSQAQRDQVISLLDSGHSGHEIHSITGFSIGVISKIRAVYHPGLPKAPGGHPRKLSEANMRHALRLIYSRRAENAVQIARALQDITNQPLSADTVHRGLKRAGMKAVVKKKKPVLTQRHRRARLDFALAHQYWTLEDWKKVVWSDETKINRLGSDGRKWVWKKPGEALNDRLVEGTLKFGGGSLMMWGCFLWEGVGYATKIDGRMDGELYVSILEDEVQQSIEYYGKEVEDVIFQQDNDPKHTCSKAKQWFQDNNLQVLQWPAQSPDLNPIEHLWEHLKKRLGDYERPPGGILELWDRVQVEWERIPVEVCQNLIESMPR